MCQPTFDAFPEVIAVSAYGGEAAQVVVRAPDVNVLVLRAADDEGVVVAGTHQHVSHHSMMLAVIIHLSIYSIYSICVSVYLL